MVEHQAQLLIPLWQWMLLIRNMRQVESLITPYLFLWPVVPGSSFRQIGLLVIRRPIPILVGLHIVEAGTWWRSDFGMTLFLLLLVHHRALRLLLLLNTWAKLLQMGHVSKIVQLGFLLLYLGLEVLVDLLLVLLKFFLWFCTSFGWTVFYLFGGSWPFDRLFCSSAEFLLPSAWFFVYLIKLFLHLMSVECILHCVAKWRLTTSSRHGERYRKWASRRHNIYWRDCLSLFQTLWLHHLYRALQTLYQLSLYTIEPLIDMKNLFIKSRWV